MPYPFDFERKGVLDVELLVKNKIFLTEKSTAVSSNLSEKNCFLIGKSFSFCEHTSVLDSGNLPSGPSSFSLAGSTGGGGGGAASTDTVGMAAVSDANPSPKWPPQDSTTATSSNAGGRGAESELLPVPPFLEIGTTGGEKCAMEDWRNVLSESVTDSPEQEQSIFRWIMGDVEDPATGSLSKVLELGGGGCGGSAASATDYEFTGGGFGIVDQGFGGGYQFGGNFMPPTVNFTNCNRSSADKNCSSNPPTNFSKFPQNTASIMYPSSLANTVVSIGLQHQTTFDSCAEMKPPPIFNPQLLVNQHQAQSTQNPSFFLPQPQQGQNSLFIPPQAKRHNPSGTGLQPGNPISSKASFSDTGQFHPHQLQLLPHYQRPMGPIGEKRKLGGNEVANFHQQEIIDQLYKASELAQAGNNPVLLQGILARLNHQLSPIGKPFHRAAFYFKEALNLLLHPNNNDSNLSRADSSPFSLIFKISAYKFFSEISPVLQFANFTCTQALMEEFEGFGRIHIVDFDIGYGGQWASLMQELAIRPCGAPALKITVLASPSTHDQLELCLTKENLVQFASEINISFEFDFLSIDCLNSSTWSLPFHDNEAVAVNLPISSLSNYQVPVPLVFRFVKQLCPRIIVSIDRGCDRTDLPFSSHIIHALQSYTNLLESFDAMNVNMDALQKIERFLVQPGVEKIMLGRFRHFEKTQHWRTLFLSSGFSPVTFSNVTESQAEFVVIRTPVCGFQVEKRQSSLVLCWQQKELISVSAWKCLV